MKQLNNSKLVEVIGIDEEKCVNCHACITACPVKYCNNGSEDHVTLNSDMCIACGSCITACTHDARYYIDDFQNFMTDIKEGDDIVAIVAPSIAASFPGMYLHLNGWLKNLGIKAVFDVSFGAELTVKSYLHHLEQNDPELIIAQPCPAIVTYLELYKPELLKHLAPADSPMVHTMKMIKKFYPEYKNHKIAIISPCNAKKREYQETGYGDYNLAYKSIHTYLEENHLSLEYYEKVDYANPPAERAVLFSSPGGLLQTAERWQPGISASARKIEGVEIIYDYLEKLPAALEEGIAPLVIDCLNCEHGCNGGPLTLTKEVPLDKIEHLVSSRSAERKKLYAKDGNGEPDNEEIEKILNKYWEKDLYARTYVNRWENVSMKYPDEEELEQIYRSMHKYSDEDIYNCSSCGYGTCEKMAIAIFNDLNRPENCHFYLGKERDKSNEEKIKSERRLTTILETSIDGFLQVDTNAVIKDVNPAMKRILKKNDIIGRSLFDFLDDDNKTHLRQQLERRTRNEQSSYELSLNQSDGKKVDCLLSGTPLYQDGKLIGSFALVSDISKLKQAEKNLKKANEELENRVKLRTMELSETVEELRATTEVIERNNVELEKLSLVASKTDNAVIIMDSKGTIEWLNEGFTKLHGYTLEEYISKYGDNILEVSNHDKIKDVLKTCLVDKEAVIYETWIEGKDGNEKWTQTTLTPVLSKNNDVDKLVAIESDISKLKLAEKEILDQKEQLEMKSIEMAELLEELRTTTDIVEEYNEELEKLSIVASQTENGVLIMDFEGNYEWINEGYTHMYGYTLNELIELKGKNIIHENSPPELIRAVEKCITEKRPTIFESESTTKDNQQIWTQTTLTPIIDDEGHMVKLVAIDSDISKLKDAEKEILLQKEEIESQRDEIQRQHDIATDQRDLLALQKQNITDSIHYASRIQKALLPPADYFKNNFSDYFIYFNPKDIVSGDFYWFKKIENLIIYAAADCTGHGVPGAFMSLLGITSLNEIVAKQYKQQNKALNAGEILNELRTYIKTSLHQTGMDSESKDGMDIALCVIDTQSNSLQFSGAYNPLYIIRKGELKEHKADRMPIGVYVKEEKQFTNNTIELNKGDKIYIFSDGYSDQFGGEKNMKFLPKNFKELLIKISDLPLKEQKEVLNDTIMEWKGDTLQVDDMLIIGVKY